MMRARLYALAFSSATEAMIELCALACFVAMIGAVAIAMGAG